MKISSSHECASCPALSESVFKECPISTLRALSEEKHTRFYPAGSAIFSEGAPISGAFCQLSGEVVLRKRDEAGADHDTCMTEPGTLLGFRGPVANGTYQVTAVAATDALLCFIPMEELEAMMRQSPTILLALMQSFCRRVDALERKAEAHSR